jgi:hypothetical protein
VQEGEERESRHHRAPMRRSQEDGRERSCAMVTMPRDNGMRAAEPTRHGWAVRAWNLHRTRGPILLPSKTRVSAPWLLTNSYAASRCLQCEELAAVASRHGGHGGGLPRHCACWFGGRRRPRTVGSLMDAPDYKQPCPFAHRISAVGLDMGA